MAINLAIGQVYCANLANNTIIVGLFQGAYGIGGTMAPLIATSMVSRGYLWSRFYLILLSLAALNLFFAAWAFWKYEASEEETDPALPPPASEQSQTTAAPQRWSSIKTLLTHKTTIFGALFIFAYQVSQSSNPYISYSSTGGHILKVSSYVSSYCSQNGSRFMSRCSSVYNSTYKQRLLITQSFNRALRWRYPDG